MNAKDRQSADVVTVPLRDLSAGQFQDIYGCDRFTATVLSSRFRYVLNHTCTHLLTNAFSPIVRDYYDFSGAISGPEELDFAVTAVAQTIAVFFGSMREAVANSVREYGVDQLKPGDVLISNDPYRNGTHVNDTCFMKPVFHEGKLISVISLRAHMLDMGAIVPGGFSGREENIYGTGLVLPPMLLFSGNKPVRSTFSLIMDNIRFGSIILPDLYAIEAALRLGEELLQESVAKYGEQAYLGAMRYACDASADAMRQALMTIPDGSYEGEDFVDCDGKDASRAYRVAVTIKKAGHRMEVDLSGTSESARTAINAGWPDAKSAVAVALKLLVEPKTAYTSAALRDVDIVLPIGTMISAVPPDAPVFAYWEPMNSLMLALMKALNGALGERGVPGTNTALNHCASGTYANGQPWVSACLCGGLQCGWGGTSAGDGDSGQSNYYMSMLDTAIEAIESDSPVVLLRREYVPDSGGAGKHRGGAGTVKDSYWLLDSVAHCLNARIQSAAGFGAYGGSDGGQAGVWMWTPEAIERAGTGLFLPVTGSSAYRESHPVTGVLDRETNEPSDGGQYHYWASDKDGLKTPARSIWRYLSNGGGGWGDPLERDPAAVMRDVRDNYVTVAGAARDYGVVVMGDPVSDPESLKVDAPATAALRTKLRADPAFDRRRRHPKPVYPAVAPPLSVEREQVTAICSECGAEHLACYPVLGEQGWFDVVKCQACLADRERTASALADRFPLSRTLLRHDMAR